jgi:endonuclease/exonuclease/phosphatase family metal-dependent hydrolase
VLLERAPDLIALQEVTVATAPVWRERLVAEGYQMIDTADLLAATPPDAAIKRKYCNLIASRWELRPLRPLDVVFPEKYLSAHVNFDRGLELHVAHLPPGVTRGLTKIEAFVAIYSRLACSCEVPRILCGDFNSPQRETRDGQTITWADHYPRHEALWDAAELSVLRGLAHFDLPDVFRDLNGWDATDVSFVAKRGDNEVGRRFDHVFASKALKAQTCDYVHEWREQRLSDHSAIETVFAAVGSG